MDVAVVHLGIDSARHDGVIEVCDGSTLQSAYVGDVLTASTSWLIGTVPLERLDVARLQFLLIRHVGSSIFLH